MPKNFWIVACRRVIKKVLSDCIHCRQECVKANAPCKGNIPKERLYDNGNPSSSTYIEYFGPINVETTKYTRKNPALNKRYAELFILNLSWFIARRGQAKIVVSDIGSNFIVGKYQLRALEKDLDRKRITQHLNSKNITWKFNLPHRPWMSGSWESLIKSV